MEGKDYWWMLKNHSVNGIRKQLRYIPKYPPKLFSTLTGKNTLLRWWEMAVITLSKWYTGKRVGWDSFMCPLMRCDMKHIALPFNHSATQCLTWSLNLTASLQEIENTRNKLNWPWENNVTNSECGIAYKINVA